MRPQRSRFNPFGLSTNINSNMGEPTSATTTTITYDAYLVSSERSSDSYTDLVQDINTGIVIQPSSVSEGTGETYWVK